MQTPAYLRLVKQLTEVVEPLSGGEKFNSLLKKIGEARFVLIGEATHGTQEFYTTRAELTQQLILKKGFMAITIEGDWPDAYLVNRYLRDEGDSKDSKAALKGFERFPSWMWRNTTLPPFLEWLRDYNGHLSSACPKVGFYGLDLYSLNASIAAVIAYLNKTDPAAAKKAQQRYACFDHCAIDPQQYGYLISLGLREACAKESLEQLLELQHHAFDYVRQNNTAIEDNYFYALQNARVVKNAEAYYRMLYEGRASSWNIRDQHMAETITALANHLENRFQRPAKLVIWAHNSHVGDARATEMGERRENNIGQLVREANPNSTYLIGFSTYEGTVTAANNWGEAPEYKQITPGIAGSYEALFHDVNRPHFLLHLTGNLIGNADLLHHLAIPRLQRAIGVVYRPDTERLSHYFFARLPYQFDSIIHFDKTTAVVPIEGKYFTSPGEPPETWPERI